MKNYKILKLGDTDIWIIDNFLSNRECSILIKAATKEGFKLKTFNSDVKKFDDRSHILGLKENYNKTVSNINQRLYDLTGFTQSHSELLIVARYRTGGNYEKHTDYFPHKNRADKNPVAGRVAQILMYLNEVEGGETYFNNIGIKIVPKKGRAVFWFGVKGMHFGDATTPKRLFFSDYAWHTPMPILEGEKWISTKFFHDRPRPPKNK